MSYPITDHAWATWGYESDEPCCVCRSTGDNRSEPRFGYTVCRDHHTTTPAEAASNAQTKDPMVRVAGYWVCSDAGPLYVPGGDIPISKHAAWFAQRKRLQNS